MQSAPSGIRPKKFEAAPRELVFKAELPPLGFATYFVQEDTSLGWRPDHQGNGASRTLRGKVIKTKILGWKGLGDCKATAIGLDN